MTGEGGVPGGQIAFLVDTTRCINCKTCEVACKDVNAVGVGVRLRRVRTFEGGSFPHIFAYNISMACNHCEDPACVSGCPARAYTKHAGTGIVVHDADRCMGCRYCTWLCPYGAPQYDETVGKIRKCDFCEDAFLNGRSPACVAACPTRAIQIGPLEELQARAGATMEIRGVPAQRHTRPACLYIVRMESTDV
jgi:anaerobic dimethyl sulfoxide reductase subunit B (iron-sulfur subunit)